MRAPMADDVIGASMVASKRTEPSEPPPASSSASIAPPPLELRTCSVDLRLKEGERWGAKGKGCEKRGVEGRGEEEGRRRREGRGEEDGAIG